MPTNCDDFPEFFSEAEMVHLEGCASFLKNIADKIEVIDMKSFQIVSTIGTERVPDGLTFVE